MYAHALRAHPRATKSATAAAIALLGDGLAQRAGGGEYDARRAASFVAWAAGTTPFIHSWYALLQRDTASPLRRALADQLAWAPPSTAAFLFWTGSTAAAAPPGAALAQGADRVRAALPATLLANWAVWGPAQLVNFRFIPVPYQILFTNCLGLGWGAALSTLGNARTPPPLEIP